jgi:hypothetical protein
MNLHVLSSFLHTFFDIEVHISVAQQAVFSEIVLGTISTATNQTY